MEGGSLLGQGTYGCLFDPPLACDEETQRRKRSKGKILGKITLPQDYAVEAEAAARITTIPNWDEYFIPIEMATACEPKAVQSQKDTDIWKCNFLRKEVGYDMSQVIHFKIKYGGVDSYSFICDPRRERGCDSDREKTLNWEGFIGQILEAGTLMALYQLVHYDIHRTNILMDPKSGLPKLIDFGMAFNADKITMETLDNRWKRIYPDQSISEMEPPEVTMATYIRKGFSSVEAYGQIMRYKEPLRKMETMLGASRQTQGREFAEFWRDSGSFKRGDWVQMFKFYWPAFDAWNIGTVLLHLLEYCYMRKDIAESGKFREAESRFKEVLRGLLRLSPKRRLDCVEALNVWNPNSKILQSERAQEWLETRAKQRG